MTLVALGDSISNGWGQPVGKVSCWSWPMWTAHALGLPIINLSQNGAEASRVVAEQMPQLPDTAELVTVMVGANGSARAGKVPDGFERDLKTLLAAASATGATVLVATLPRGMRNLRWWWKPTIEQRVLDINAIIRAQADEQRAVLVEAESLFDDRPWLLGADRVHPNAAGQLRLARQALTALGREPVRPLPQAPEGRSAGDLSGQARVAFRRVVHRQ